MTYILKGEFAYQSDFIVGETTQFLMNRAVI